MFGLLSHVALYGTFLVGCTSPDEPPPIARPDAVSEPSGNLARLTHLQWENSVVALLGLPGPTGLTDDFLPDPRISTFENDAAGLFLNPTLFQQYQAASETLATRVVQDALLYQQNVGALTVGAPDRDAWIAAFGERAYRRPLTADEVRRHALVFDRGPVIFASDDPFADGVRATIAAFLQSPHFLYRNEQVEDGAEAITDASLVVKLSYSLWNAPPDAELVTAAEQGFDDATLQAQVERMLSDDRGHAMVADLHRQLWHIDNYQTIQRTNEEVFANFELSLPAAMVREAYAYADATVYEGGTVDTLLTSRRTFVDERLAAMYGVDGVTGNDALVRVTLPEGERAGLLTLSGFLALHAGRTSPNPIRRGGFVNTVLLCNDVPPPPAFATPLPADGTGTVREQVTAHTQACGSTCHEMLNPPGFALGHYDEVGAYQTEDAGQAIDATGTLTTSLGVQSFDGAIELAEVLARTPEVHRCYATRLLGYLEQRGVRPEDEARIDALASASLQGRPILALMQDIVTHPDFRRNSALAPEE